MYSEMYDASFEEVSGVARGNADFCMKDQGVFHQLPGGKCGTKGTEVFVNSRVLVTETTKFFVVRDITVSTVTFLNTQASVSFREGPKRKCCAAELLEGIQSTIYLSEIESLLDRYTRMPMDEEPRRIASALKEEFCSMDRDKCPPSEFINFWVRCLDQVVNSKIDTESSMHDSVCGPDVMEMTAADLLIRVRRLRLLGV